MTTTAVKQTREKEDEAVRRWSSDDPHVRAARRFVLRQDELQPEDLVKWDAAHGKHLFLWNDTRAGHEYRVHQARNFINRIAWIVDNAIGKVRIKAMYSVSTGDRTTLEEDEPTRVYRSARDVTGNAKDRSEVIAYLTKRMLTCAADLRFFKLTKAEQRELLTQIERAISVE